MIELQKIIEGLREELAKYKGQKALNSGNSSKPPSSDGEKKPKRDRSLRERSGRLSGGQPGHAGTTLSPSKSPTHIENHRVSACSECKHDLSTVAADIEARQVFDIPLPVMEVTEHRAESKTCPGCGTRCQASFPPGVEASLQYGPNAEAVVTYLRDYQLLPSERTQEVMDELFGCPMSEGTIAAIISNAGELVSEPVADIKAALIVAEVGHFDESGCRVGGVRQWLHTASTSLLTFFDVHKKRGTEAMVDIGILPNFTGRAIHDHWVSYYTFLCSHGECNAHILRELKFVKEEMNMPWAQQMTACLMDIKRAVDASKQAGQTRLLGATIAAFERQYQAALSAGYMQNPLPDLPAGQRKRGRRKKNKSRNLLERLDAYREQTLAFMYDFNVPFDNNQAERDIRMIKVQQKISGTFRSPTAAAAFCRVRSYISTARKQGHRVLDALKAAFAGAPLKLA